MFANQYGASKLLIHDGSLDQIGGKSIFQSHKEVRHRNTCHGVLST